MSKFSKRILTSSAHCRNSVILGNGIGYLPDLISHCNSVFMFYDVDQKNKSKNIIHRASFNNLELITEVDFVFCDRLYLRELHKLRELLIANRPVIFIEDASVIEKEHFIYLKSAGFALVEIFKNMQKWVPT